MNESNSECLSLNRPVSVGGLSSVNSGVKSWRDFQRPSVRVLFFTVSCLILAAALAACGSSSSTPANIVSPPPAPTTGGISISGRINPASSTLSTISARPDRVTATIQEAAISSDDGSYETIITGPIQVTLDETSSPPSIGNKGGIVTGAYRALRLTLSALDWDVQWGFSNPSPCDGAVTGSATGTLDLSVKPVLYFKTADLGGNTLAHYQANPPLSGYPGDAEHPFIIPAPIEITSNKTTTVNLLLDTYSTLGCNRVSVFSRDDDGDIAPQREIDGPATKTYDLALLTSDPRRNEIAVNNSFTSSIAFFNGDTAGGDVDPTRMLTGPATALNSPSGVAFYCPKVNPTDETCDANITATDQYIVANRNNNSLTTYAATAGDNTAPVRTIFGYKTELNEPSAITLNISATGIPANDEIWAANRGNNSITSYARLDFGNSQPLRTPIKGTSTGLAKPCGIAVDKQNEMLFVTNSDNNSITVYHTNDTGNIAPFITLAGSNTGLSSPCGIFVDGTNGEVIVANTGNDSILTFSNDALNSNYAFNIGANNVAPIRSISGSATRIHKPVGLLVAGNKLWITHKGGQVAMATPPTITPVSTSTVSSNAQLNGDYNIVINGVDLRQGVNGLGIQIPVMFSERGTAHFDAQATPWPTFSFNVDTESRRQILESGCTTPDFQTKNGFYGMAANQHFYAATEEHQGILDGGFVSDGQSFTSTFHNGKEIFVVYGTKATGTKVPYLSGNGTAQGSATQYAYASYYNQMKPNVSPISAITPDTLSNTFEVGALDTTGNSFLSIITDYNYVLTNSPMGYVGSTQALFPFQRLQYETKQIRPYFSHAGGFFENPDYGMAGLISGDGDSLLFMRDITDKDSSNCSQSFGMGIGIRQNAAHTYNVAKVKGTYFVSGFGDKYLSVASRPQYFSVSGNITFDGAGVASIALVDNVEGDLISMSDTFSYKVSSRKISSSSLTTDVIDIYGKASTVVPYASAFIARDGRTLIFYSPTGAGTSDKRDGNETRLLGFAVLQSP